MVAPLINTENLKWYLITLKLKEAVDANIKSNPASPSLLPIQSPSSSTPLPPQSPLQQPKTAATTARSTTTKPLLPFRHGGKPPRPAPPLPVESEWVISIRFRLDQAKKDEHSCPWPKLSIYRVPKTLKQGDEKAYVPQLASIGPFHRGGWWLNEMERHKWRALHHVMRRTHHNIRVYLESVREIEDKARACYEGHIPISSDEFVECMVVDGCFLLEVLRGATAEGFSDLGYSRHDPIFSMRGAMHAIRQDMIMLENQIPLFILDRLLALQLGFPPTHRGLVAPLALHFFDPLMPNDNYLHTNGMEQKKPPKRAPPHTKSQTPFDPLADDGLHCLDVFRRSLLHTQPQPTRRIWKKRWSQKNRVADRRRQQLIHCVTELRKAGIKFRRGNSDRFWDVKFESGVLRIPRLFIHDGSKSLFLNLIAFEQCHVDLTNNITSYVIFMDNLINSAEDVSHLHYCGILEHWLGDDHKVADLFNKLCQEVVFDINDSYLSDLSGKVNRYYNYRWNTWRASLKHKYFGNPWAIISLVAAVVLLLLTAAQSFYAVYAYYLPTG